MINKKLFRFIIQYRVLIIIIFIFITIFFTFFSLKTVIDMGTYTLLPKDDPEIIKFNNTSKNFGGFDNMIIFIKGNNNILMENVAEEIAKSMKKLNKYVKYVDYKYPIDFIEENSLLYLNDDMFEKVVYLIENNIDLLKLSQEENNISKMLLYLSTKKNITEKEITIINELIEKIKDPSFKMFNMKYYYNRSKTTLLIFLRPTNANHDMLFFEKMVSEVRKNIDPVLKKYSNLNIGITGMPVIMAEQQKNLNEKITIISIFVLLFLIILFIFSFKRISSAFYIVVPIIVAIIWTLGINYLVIGRLNIVTSIFAILLLGLGVDFSLHFLTKFYYEINLGKNVINSLEEVFNQTLSGIFVGAITTAASFYVLMFSKFKGLYELGFIAGTGILMSLLSIIFLLPSIISYSNAKPYPIIMEENLSKYFENKLLKNKYIIIVIIFSIIFIPFLFKNNIEFNYNAFDLLPKLPSVKLENILKKDFDTSFEYNILIAKNIEESREQYNKLKKTNIYSEIDSLTLLIPENQTKKIFILKELNKKYLSEKKPKVANISLNLVTMLALSQIKNDKIFGKIESLELKKFLEDLNKLNKKEQQKIQLNIKKYFSFIIKSIESASKYGEISIERLPDYIKDKYLDKNNNIATFVFIKEGFWDEQSMKKVANVLRKIDENSTGTTFVWIKLIDYIRDDLYRSSFLVFILIFFIVLLYFRNLKITLLTLTPVILGTLWLINFMSLFNIKFNIANIVVIPLILGIGIDDGIHMIHNYIENKSIIKMLKQSGKAVIITSITSMVGFGSLYFVKDPLVSQMGILLFFGILFCLIISLIVLPIFIQLFKKSIFE
ncbi:efflux RND transporter permease subunit [Marinitoga arctica]